MKPIGKKIAKGLLGFAGLVVVASIGALKKGLFDTPFLTGYKEDNTRHDPDIPEENDANEKEEINEQVEDTKETTEDE